MTATLLIAAAAAFALAGGFYLTWLARYDTRWRRIGVGLTLVATALLAGAVVVELGGFAPAQLPLGPRVLMLVALGVSAIFLGGRLRADLPIAGPVVAPLAFAVTFALAVKAMRGELPSSASAMGTVTALHIGATMLGFLLFAPAYVLSVLFLNQEYHLRAKTRGPTGLPSLLKSEQAAWRLLYAGFPLYSLGVLLGFVWQERAEVSVAARPEHILAAISWVIFAGLTYRRLKTGWRGRRSALVLNAGFVITLAAVLLYVMR